MTFIVMLLEGYAYGVGYLYISTKQAFGHLKAAVSRFYGTL